MNSHQVRQENPDITVYEKDDSENVRKSVFCNICKQRYYQLLKLLTPSAPPPSHLSFSWLIGLILIFDCRFDQESFQSHQMLIMKANSVVKRKPELYSNDLIICPSKCCFATKDLADYEKHLNHTGHKALAENKFLVREGFKKVMGLGHCLNTEGRREEAGEGGGGGGVRHLKLCIPTSLSVLTVKLS